MSKIVKQSYNFVKFESYWDHSEFICGFIDKINNVKYNCGKIIKIEAKRYYTSENFKQELFINEFENTCNSYNGFEGFNIRYCNLECLNLTGFKKLKYLCIFTCSIENIIIEENLKLEHLDMFYNKDSVFNILTKFNKENVNSISLFNENFTEELIKLLNNKNFNKVICHSCYFNKSPFDYEEYKKNLEISEVFEIPEDIEFF